MSVVLFRKKIDNSTDLFKKKKELKKKLPHLIHSISLHPNEIVTMSVESYLKSCINGELYKNLNKRISSVPINLNIDKVDIF